jgi:hypothetical protein
MRAALAGLPGGGPPREAAGAANPDTSRGDGSKRDRVGHAGCQQLLGDVARLGVSAECLAAPQSHVGDAIADVPLGSIDGDRRR